MKQFKKKVSQFRQRSKQVWGRFLNALPKTMLVVYFVGLIMGVGLSSGLSPVGSLCILLVIIALGACVMWHIHADVLRTNGPVAR